MTDTELRHIAVFNNCDYVEVKRSFFSQIATDGRTDERHQKRVNKTNQKTSNTPKRQAHHDQTIFHKTLQYLLITTMCSHFLNKSVWHVYK